MNAIIALNPQQMHEAQSTTIQWADARLQDAKRELSLAEQTYNALHAAKLRTQAASGLIRKARRRIAFYEKVRAALEAGYYIVPPFDVQWFAVRTNRAAPSADVSMNRWENDQTVPALPMGAGEYVDPRPKRQFSHEVERKNSAGNTYKDKYYENGDWRDVDLPVRAMKPTLIEAAGNALALKVFDALGIAPGYRTSDPMIIGQIKRHDNKPALCFFIAWWLDEADL